MARNRNSSPAPDGTASTPPPTDPTDSTVTEEVPVTDSTDSQTPDPTEEVPVTEEVPDTSDSTDSTEEVPDTSDITAEEVPVTDPVADTLTAIESAIAAEGAVDVTTGAVSEEALSAVRSAYKALTTARRNKVQAEVAARMTAALRSTPPNMTRALALGAVSEALAVTPSGSTEKAPADPYAGVVELHVAVELARDALLNWPTTLPQGVDAETLSQKVSDRLTAITQGDESVWTPDNIAALLAGCDAGEGTPAEVIAATKIMSGKAAGVRPGRKSSGPRAPRTPGAGQRDLGKIITEVMSDHVGEELKVSDICRLAEEAGHGVLSSGAVSNRIKSGTVPGLHRVTVNGALGARYDG